mmetsp:Transcript_120251/g.256650  ORF Transcript_120251/g.256650 Transcript_120251/m.256650 type:complete len:347 (-) Transcript_120251:37-1077(-)
MPPSGYAPVAQAGDDDIGAKGRGRGAASIDCGGVSCYSNACGVEERSILSWVGSGNGNYRQTTSYEYAGEGCGDFQIVEVPTSWFCSGWCVACGVGSGLLLLLGLLWMLFGGSETTTTTYLISTSQPYDCAAGYNNWQRGWSIGKKAWCCDHHGLACPPSTSSEPWDCKIQGAPVVIGTWPLAKKAWCCQHYGAACPTTPRPPMPTKPPPPNCMVGAPWTWGVDKKVYCCLHHNRGCPTLPPPPSPPPPPRPTPPPCTTSLPFDCDAGYHGCYACLIKQWSVAKLAWCCQHAGRGCPAKQPAPQPAPPYDCNAGFNNYALGWSVGKKVWCCKSARRGCPPGKPVPY